MSPKPVPREKIPWYPSVASEKCNGCKVCFDFCPNGVYAWDDKGGLAVVREPFRCTVGCNGCEGLCAQGAISFPDLDTINAIIKKLREEA